MTRTISLILLVACNGKDPDCPEGTVLNFEGECAPLGGDTDTDTPDTDETDDTGDTGEGVSYDVCSKDAPHTVIQAAIDEAAAGATITLCPETFNETLTIDKAITLTGPDDGPTARIDARGDGVVISVSPAASGAVLSHLVLRNGDAAPSDGSGGYGGGLRVEGATVTISHLQIEDGIASVSGGGLALIGSDALVEDLVVKAGRAADAGGGVYVSGGAPIFRRLTVEGSYAGRGGGLYATKTPMQLSAGVFFGNDVQQHASGILIEGGQGIVLSNVVVAIGTGDSDTCAADTEDGATLVNSAAYNNEGVGLCTSSSSGHNLSYANTVAEFRVGGVDGPGDNDLTSDPFFIGPTTGDFTIRETSPCVDAGDPDTAYNDRDGTRADIGAFGGPHSFEE
jgi:hypothetical protein